jgi:hypothetical protein
MVGSRPSFPLLIILLLIGAPASGQSLDAAAHGLAAKIAALLKLRQPVTLSLHNVSSMTPAEAVTAEADLERELHSLGVATAESGQGTTDAQRGAEVKVTISENLRGLAWVAEVQTADARAVVIEETPKPSPAAGATSMTIEKKLVLEQDQQILDLAIAGRGLLVLDAEAVTMYESAAAGGWQRKLSVRIPASRPWPRDLRGRIVAQGDAYQAYLPGLTCHGNAAGGLSITCRDESLWPIGAGLRMMGFARFTPARNYFDGRTIASNGSQASVPPFFSVAGFQTGETTAWALAGLDGQAHFYNTPIKNSVAWSALGSGIAGLESECGARSQVFATAAGDATATDSVTAYDIIDGAPRSTGQTVAFAGPVTALWPAAERGVAFAVSRDLKSGRYAAFRLAITCTH